jgi:hypothetical protein
MPFLQLLALILLLGSIVYLLVYEAIAYLARGGGGGELNDGEIVEVKALTAAHEDEVAEAATREQSEAPSPASGVRQHCVPMCVATVRNTFFHVVEPTYDEGIDSSDFSPISAVSRSTSRGLQRSASMPFQLNQGEWPEECQKPRQTVRKKTSKG